VYQVRARALYSCSVEWREYTGRVGEKGGGGSSRQKYVSVISTLGVCVCVVEGGAAPEQAWLRVSTRHA
jgi:hypothetical protein